MVWFSLLSSRFCVFVNLHCLILNFLNDVDFLVRTKFSDEATPKDESAKTNINIISDVDSKEKSKDSSTIKSSSNKEVVKESLDDENDEKYNEIADAKDLLSLLETLSSPRRWILL
jgi:hypothetical protein